jgi:membrane protease YdiL (CAAX protease family)
MVQIGGDAMRKDYPDGTEDADRTDPEYSVRDDPRYDGRRVTVFFIGLIVFYAGSVAVIRPGTGDIVKVALPIMFAPTIGAVLAVLVAHARIRFGRVTTHVLLAFVPPAVILGVTWVATSVTSLEVHPEHLLTLLALSPVIALLGMVSSAGEEIGWRGFLWPLLRRHRGFWTSALVMLPIWWLYHLPPVLWWGYGSVPGLPAFTVAITGIVLFAGVLTDRSASVWPSVLLHSTWNGMVATAFVTSGAGESIPTCTSSGCPGFFGGSSLFTGSQSLLGEFGWIAALTMLVLGVLAGVWHLRRPVSRTSP